MFIRLMELPQRRVAWSSLQMRSPLSSFFLQKTLLVSLVHLSTWWVHERQRRQSLCFLYSFTLSSTFIILNLAQSLTWSEAMVPLSPFQTWPGASQMGQGPFLAQIFLMIS